MPADQREALLYLNPLPADLALPSSTWPPHYAIPVVRRLAVAWALQPTASDTRHRHTLKRAFCASTSSTCHSPHTASTPYAPAVCCNTSTAHKSSNFAYMCCALATGPIHRKSRRPGSTGTTIACSVDIAAGTRRRTSTPRRPRSRIAWPRSPQPTIRPSASPPPLTYSRRINA